MSTYILSSCWSLQGMSSTQKLVLISLADQANDEGVCWPSLKKMAARTCLSERAIREAINWLSSTKILKISHRFNSSNVYTIDCSLYNPAPVSPHAPVSPPAPNAAPPAPSAAPPLRQVPTNLQLEPTMNLHLNNKMVVGDFDIFWECYPNKTAKQAAVKAWGKLKPNNELFNTIIDALKKQKQFFKIGFIPHPATWLNGKRWEDAITNEKEVKVQSVYKQNYQGNSDPNAVSQPIHVVGQFDDAVKNRVSAETFKKNKAHLNSLLED